MIEKDVDLGGGNDVDFKLDKGQVVVTLGVQAANAGLGLKGGAFVQMDAKLFVDKVIAMIEAKSPSGVVVFEETVRGLIDANIASS